MKEYTPIEVMDRIQNKESVDIIDVRENEEWESGHIPSAKHIPLGELPSRLHEIDKNKETIVVCRSGKRSVRACAFLLDHGYHVINMAGGMLNWSGEIRTEK